MKRLDQLKVLVEELEFLADGFKSRYLAAIPKNRPRGESSPPPGFFDSAAREAREGLREADKVLKGLKNRLEEKIQIINGKEQREIYHQCYLKEGRCVICEELRESDTITPE